MTPFRKLIHQNSVVAGIAIALLVLSAGITISVVAQGRIDTSRGDIVNQSGERSSSVNTDDTSTVTEELPKGANVDLIKATIEKGWTLRLEAGLDRNRGREAEYKELLRKYYSAVATNDTKTTDIEVDEMMRMPPQPPSEKQIEQVAPFQFVSPDAPELEKQWNYIDYGRYNEQIANFRVLDFGVDGITYLKILVKDGKAEVVVDIKYWSEFVHTNPDGSEVTSRPHGGERHTFVLVRESSGWRIVSDTFTILPGFEP